MSSQTDIVLSNIYKNMLNINNIVNISGNTLLLTETTLGSDLNISGKLIIQNNSTVLNNLYISGFSNINNNFTCLSFANINDSLICSSDITSFGNLYISSNSILGGLLNISSTSIVGQNVQFNSMYISGTSRFTSGTIVNDIYGSILTFNAPIINIGNNNSIVYINGTKQYLTTSNEYVIDKQIYLNYDNILNSGIDDGSNAGIEIIGINGVGLISTNENASKYKIVSPLANSPINYIATLDLNNNLIVTGSSNLRNDVSMVSILNVSGSTIFNNNSSFNSSLNIRNSYISLGSLTGLNSLVVNGNSTFMSSITVNNTLYVSNLTNIQKDILINGNLCTVSSTSTTLLNLDVTLNSSLNVSGSVSLNTGTINGNLNISGSSVINGPLISNSNLYVSGNTILNGNVSVTGNANILNSNIIYGNVTVNGNILSSGPTILNGNISVGYDTTLTIFNILGPLSASIKEYSDNTSAKNAGIPVYGFYRTGGIIKVRLYDQLPSISLIGSSPITISTGNIYIEPGVSAIGTYDNSPLNPYINNIVDSNSTNVINGPINIVNNYIITSISTLSSGTYTINYQAIDDFGNVGNIIRTLILS